MVVDIVVYSLILPSSLFGLVHEENGAKLELREDQKERLFQSRAAWRRKRWILSSQHAEKYRLNWTTHKPMGWVLQGRRW
jgi:hypothetical protein